MNPFRKYQTGIISACVVVYVLYTGCRAPQPDRAGTSGYAPVLEVVYFIPADQQPNRDYVKRINTIVGGAKIYFDHWMNFWGYTRRMMLDDSTNSGQINITTIYGKHDLKYYINHGAGALQAETDHWHRGQETTNVLRTRLIFTCVNGTEIAGVPFCAKGSSAFVIDAPKAIGKKVHGDAGNKQATYDLTTGTYHELGHAMGLPHNWGNANDNDRLGYTLMGHGDGHPVEKCYLTAADCALLNSSPVFMENPAHDVNLELLAISGTNYGAGASIKGKFSIKADSVVNVLFYNDCFVDGHGDNQDYDATTWTGAVINNDSFSVQMPYRDFRFNYDTAYQLRIGFCTRKGATKWMSFRYTMKNGIFSGEITEMPKPFNIAGITSLTVLMTAGLLFIYLKPRI